MATQLSSPASTTTAPVIGAAEYFAGRQGGEKVAYLAFSIIANGRRSEVSRFKVSGKSEARKLAKAAGYRPWNF